MSDDFELPKAIRDGFLVDTLELINQVEVEFLTLEKNPDNTMSLDAIFRLMHNLKGSAQSVGFDQLSEFAHRIEDFLVSIKKGVIQFNPKVFDVLLKACDCIKLHVVDLQSDFKAPLDAADILEKIQRASSKDQAEEAPVKTVSNVKDFPKSPNAQAVSKTKANSKDAHVRVSLRKIDDFLNLFGEQVILQSSLDHAKNDPQKNQEVINKLLGQLSKITYELQHTAISFRMVSLEKIFSQMERVTRDTASMVNKKVELVTSGRDNELDKTIVDALSDPLTHMIRNAIDHGIETPEERLKAGKPEVGTLRLGAYRKGSFFYIELSDDGRGLDQSKIFAKAVEKGLIDISANATLTENEIFNLILQKGFSTRDEVSELSGRGIGMDVVHDNITRLKGSLSIHSKPGEGTYFRIRLPLTLAIFSGLSVRVGEQTLIIPNSDIDEVVHFSAKQQAAVNQLENVIQIRDQVHTLIDLREELGTTHRRTSGKKTTTRAVAVVTSVQSQTYALLVDEVISQQRVVHKSFGAEVQTFPGAAGATILSDGTVAIILELQAFLAGRKRAG